MRYINVRAVKKVANDQGHSVGKDFLEELDRYIDIKIRQSCRVWNGSSKRLNRTIAAMVMK